MIFLSNFHSRETRITNYSRPVGTNEISNDKFTPLDNFSVDNSEKSNKMNI